MKSQMTLSNVEFEALRELAAPPDVRDVELIRETGTFIATATLKGGDTVRIAVTPDGIVAEL